MRCQAMTPMMSDSFMIRSSSPSSLTSVHVHGNELAALVTAARSNSDDLAFLRLFLSGIGNDDATFGLLFGTDAAHDHAVVQGTEFSLGHGLPRALARVS